MVLEKKGEWQVLLKLAQQEVKHDPANAAAWYSARVAYTHLKQYTQAVHARRERKLDPSRAERYFNTYILP
ncbi:hypothetical protein EBAPG3_002470 [Nitrosospira lacus]|uniref:Uncharacterized protein n=2 Tax=Nitrosospira lacus TaxID=1288494 RepID=A0A1W6SLQ0_9PROT|nr:hypothetical protein EBAPG3_002470 [Nitrosospira lacus]